MPRPGPRPYECVRRAWHSDRHRPMRGSLIQEIFRVVKEIHSSATKKNKEWQEKLPIVVLRAEEIMYSKANSEAEYMDFETLWDRTNDAINTIIRREESTETGDLLQPCIEAALILGCTARRASRSQRNSNPWRYLNQNGLEITPASPRAPDNVPRGGSSGLPPSHPGNPTSAPRFIPHYSTPTTARPTVINTTQLRSDSCTPVTHQSNPTLSHGFPFATENLPNQIPAMEGHRPVNVARSYPLYYGTVNRHQSVEAIPRPPEGSTSTAMPQVQDPIGKRFVQSLYNNDRAVNGSNRNTAADVMGKNIEDPTKVHCDLSLRLGPVSAPYASALARCTREVEAIELCGSQEGSKPYDAHPRTTKEFCFFPMENADEPLESAKWVSSVEGPSRKRKAPVNNPVEGEHFSHQSNFPHNLYFGRMNQPDK